MNCTDPDDFPFPRESGQEKRERRPTMDIRVDDILEMKKPHPCGSRRFTVLRVGMDFRLKCDGCGHEVMVPRVKIERHIKKVVRPQGQP